MNTLYPEGTYRARADADAAHSAGACKHGTDQEEQLFTSRIQSNTKGEAMKEKKNHLRTDKERTWATYAIAIIVASNRD